VLRHGQEIIHRKAGAFRKKQFIAQEDERFNFHLALSPGEAYIMLIRVRHSKYYQPTPPYVNQSQFVYQTSQRITASTKYLLLGAIAILSCYCLVAYALIRYRPYLWTFIFLAGIAGFSFSLDADFIDFFFSDRPETGWLLVQPFLHLGVIGFYMMVLHLVQSTDHPHRLRHAGQLLILLLIVFDIFSLLNKGLGSNYYQTNRYHLFFVLAHLSYLSWVVLFLWKRLDSAQRYWGYAVVLFAISTVFVVAVSVTMNENSYSLLSMWSKTNALVIGILLLTGINRQLKQHEQDKLQALQRLNDLQQRHTFLIERKVAERTEQL